MSEGIGIAPIATVKILTALWMIVRIAADINRKM